MLQKLPGAERGTMGVGESEALELLDERLRTMLPAEYQDSYEEMQPVSMGTAGLKYGSDGKVAWDEIWGSFCDLAMAGGPPHKGKLLEPAPLAEIDAHSSEYAEVAEEICRGITMASDLDARPSSSPGWIRVACYSEEMAGWLLRAIAMENVAVRGDRLTLELPAGPHYRLHKEIKNVVTVIAKTCHYWMGHMPREQKRAIADLFAKIATESALIVPAQSNDRIVSNDAQELHDRMAAAIEQETGLRRSDHRYSGWLGLQCSSVRAALWMMRALVASNVLSRREENVLFVPVNPAADPQGETVQAMVKHVHRLAVARHMY